MCSLSERLQTIRNRATGLGPPLTAAEVDAFEAAHAIRLPEQYRRFLIEVGNGANGPPHYGLLPLRAIPPGHHLSAEEQLARLANPFPFREAWVWENEPELSDEQQALIERAGDGAIVLGTDGCGMDWHLVVTGPERGQMWNLCGEGATPCVPRRDFASWFCRWLEAGGASAWWYEGAH